MVEQPDGKEGLLKWMVGGAVASLPAIAAVLIGMYVQTQQLIASLTSLDKDVTALKIEVAQIRKEYVSREELSRTIELITAKRGH